jgi:hypothetical protein
VHVRGHVDPAAFEVPVRVARVRAERVGVVDWLYVNGRARLIEEAGTCDYDEPDGPSWRRLFFRDDDGELTELSFGCDETVYARLTGGDYDVPTRPWNWLPPHPGCPGDPGCDTCVPF